MLSTLDLLPTLNYFMKMVIRIIPLLFIAVFLAELARLKLGGDKLSRLLAGTHPWDGRLRGAFLGALLPYCECGAFPVMLGLLRAGVPMGTALTFFMISPLVSVPAFMILMSVLGPAIAFLYLGITVLCGLAASLLLEKGGQRWGILKGSFLQVEDAQSCCGNGLTSSPCQAAPSCGDGESCCESASQGSPVSYIGPAWDSTWNTVKKILPFAFAAILFSTVIHSQISPEQINRLLTAGAPFDVFIAALAGIPFYACTSTTISVVAPFISSTGAVGPGIAFIISAAGTSINGIIFMNAIFGRRFIAVFVFSIFLIALLSGYFLQMWI